MKHLTHPWAALFSLSMIAYAIFLHFAAQSYSFSGNSLLSWTNFLFFLPAGGLLVILTASVLFCTYAVWFLPPTSSLFNRCVCTATALLMLAAIGYLCYGTSIASTAYAVVISGTPASGEPVLLGTMGLVCLALAFTRDDNAAAPVGDAQPSA